MFDIGFWEIALIVVVALLVVGPEEFPSLVRNIGLWLGKMRRFVTDVKNDFETEVNKAEELKRLLGRESQIAELHQQIDPGKPSVPIAPRSDVSPDATDRPAEQEQQTDTEPQPEARPGKSSDASPT